MQEATLPIGWAWARVGDITEPISKVDPHHDPSRAFVYLDISSIDNVDHRITEPKRYLGSDAPSRARQRVCGGDVLFSTVRTYLENIAVVPDAFNGQVASTGFAVLRGTSGISSKYLFYHCLTQSFLAALEALQRGTSYPAVRDEDVRAQTIAIAPTAEQERIVAEIETQFTRLDAGVAALKRAQANLKRYRAAVLKAACAGSLVPQDPSDEPASDLLARILAERRAKWEADLRAKGKNPATARYDEPAAPNTDDLPQLPDGWCWTTFEMIGEIQGGIQKQPSRRPKNNAYPFLRVANVPRGRLDLTDVHRIELFGDELERLRLAKGDMLIVEGNGSPAEIGRNALWNDDIPDCVHQNHLIRVRFNRIVPGYVSFYLNSPAGSDQMLKAASSTSGLHTLSVSKVKSVTFPLPPLPEQERIVAEVERRLSVMQEQETVIARSLKRAERLRQAILAHAFAGNLVPHDPDDEPARVLLDRIRAQRARDGGAAPKGRRRRNDNAGDSRANGADIREPLSLDVDESGAMQQLPLPVG